MNKIALVTGASSGIGKEFCSLLAADGYDLLLVARDADALEQVKVELSSRFKVKVQTLAMDLSQSGAADMLWDSLGAQKLDIVINNAGFGDLTDLVDADWPKLEAMINLNITTLTRLSQLAAISMKKRGTGHILNVASVLSFFPAPHSAVYGATKSYVLHFSEALSEELRGTGIYVSALCPGPTQTGFAKEANMQNSKVMSGSLPTAKDVAACGYNALKANKVVVVHGFKTKLNALVGPKLVPRSLMRKIIANVQSQKSN